MAMIDHHGFSVNQEWLSKTNSSTVCGSNGGPGFLWNINARMHPTWSIIVYPLRPEFRCHTPLYGPHKPSLAVLTGRYCIEFGPNHGIFIGSTGLVSIDFIFLRGKRDVFFFKIGGPDMDGNGVGMGGIITKLNRNIQPLFSGCFIAAHANPSTKLSGGLIIK